MKITKSTFLGQNNEDNSEGQKGGQENFVGIGGIPQSRHYRKLCLSKVSMVALSQNFMNHWSNLAHFLRLCLKKRKKIQ